MNQSIISYDTKNRWDRLFSESSASVLSAVKDMRRSASNLLDLCWTAQGSLDAMVDLRGILPVVHVSGTHMVKESGGTVLDLAGRDFRVALEVDERMSFVAASGRRLAEEIVRLYSFGLDNQPHR
jgi:fructose-1,6-bisphosphatase/inositol monophosphatase family enzyme